MKTISCPWCNSPVRHAISTQVCPTCGKTLHSATPTTSTIAQLSETSERDPDVTEKSSHLKALSHKVLFTLSHFWPSPSLSMWWSNRRSQKRESRYFTERMAFSIPLTLDPLDEVQFTGSLQGSTSEDSSISELRPDGQRTWRKVVAPSPRRKSYIYPPRPPMPDNEPMKVSATHVSVMPVSQSSSTLEAFKRSTVSRMKRTSPKVIFWLSTTLLLLSVSLFGITNTFGHRQVSPTDGDTRLSLQITPNELSFGATMNLRGEHFSPYAAVGFTRDNSVPLTDTSNAPFTQADRTGYFTDTIIVGNDWGTGSHVITAEDSLTHKVASFPVSISGQGIVSRPPHLHLSVSTLDFGSGDQTTDSTKTLTLLNSEGSQITWQGSPSESWLLITPKEGSFTHDVPQQVTIAVDRSQLQPGSHTASVHFSSNGGDESLAVSTEVTSLQPEHEAVMQISPAVLSFTAADGSNSPSSQQIKVSNSGGQAMNWSTSADVPWLTVSRPSITIAPGTFAIVQVSVASHNLLPGTHTGTLTFTAQNMVGGGIVFNSPQHVVVSLTITPPCTLLAKPAMLDFSSAYLQPSPQDKQVNMTATPGCSVASLHWSASSNVPWLTLNKTAGTTPSTLSVGIDTTDLTPNTYTGAITVSSPTGTQTVTVRFTLRASSVSAALAVPPALAMTPSSISMKVPGTTSASVTLANTGGGALNWSAKLPRGAPSFVSLSATSGYGLAGGEKTSFNVVVNADGVASGQYRVSIKISATNAENGYPVTGGTKTILVTITVT